MLSSIAVRFPAGDINVVYLAAINASVSGCAYAIYALAVARLACSDEYFEEPGVDVKIGMMRSKYQMLMFRPIDILKS